MQLTMASRTLADLYVGLHPRTLHGLTHTLNAKSEETFFKRFKRYKRLIHNNNVHRMRQQHNLQLE